MTKDEALELIKKHIDHHQKNYLNLRGADPMTAKFHDGAVLGYCVCDGIVEQMGENDGE